MNVLLIEDNEDIIKGLTYSFLKQNINLISFKTIKETILYLKTNPKIEIILLDVTLPDGNGFTFFTDYLKELSIPTIFLTAKIEEEDIVKGLTIGAEDYLTKPFSTKELLARMNKIILRKEEKSLIKIDDIIFDLDKMIVKKKETKLDLTPLELKILHLLFLNKNHVVTRENLLDKLWEWTGNDVDDHTITVYLKRIREKLKTDIIKTVKGIGYLIDDEKK